MSGSVAGEFAIETYSGRFVDTHNPRPETIDCADIAHALAQTCRFGGHSLRFYSVAEHAVLVSRRLEQKGYGPLVQLAGLHHDDAEAYLADIPRPFKPLLGDVYEALTDQMDEAIVTGLRLPFASRALRDPAVKLADTWALFVEARHLLPSRGRSWNLKPDARVVTPEFFHNGLAPDVAKHGYLSRHRELGKACRAEA